MVSASIPAKIIKPPGEKVDEVETQVSQVQCYTLTRVHVTVHCIPRTLDRVK